MNVKKFVDDSVRKFFPAWLEVVSTDLAEALRALPPITSGNANDVLVRLIQLKEKFRRNENILTALEEAAAAIVFAFLEDPNEVPQAPQVAREAVTRMATASGRAIRVMYGPMRGR
jgi:hypothetical protein